MSERPPPARTPATADAPAVSPPPGALDGPPALDPLAVPEGHEDEIHRGSSELTYQPALDGLRGIAVLAVLGYHGGVSFAAGGFLGVEAFFVLSGFLITSLLVAEWHEHSGIRLGAFWGRRARRLLPALFAVVAVVGLHQLFAGVERRRPRPARRRDRHLALRRQLAPDRGGERVLRRDRGRVAAAAHLVARDRGAVLRRLAPRRARGHDARPPPGAGPPLAEPGPAAAARHRRRRCAVLLGAHGRALRERLGVEPGLLRHRHPGRGRPRRRRARHRALGLRPAAPPSREAWCLGGGHGRLRRPARRDLARERDELGPVPGRLPARRPRRGGDDPGGRRHPGLAAGAPVAPRAAPGGRHHLLRLVPVALPDLLVADRALDRGVGLGAAGAAPRRRLPGRHRLVLRHRAAHPPPPALGGGHLAGGPGGGRGGRGLPRGGEHGAGGGDGRAGPRPLQGPQLDGHPPRLRRPPTGAGAPGRRLGRAHLRPRPRGRDAQLRHHDRRQGDPRLWLQRTRARHLPGHADEGVLGLRRLAGGVRRRRHRGPAGRRRRRDGALGLLRPPVERPPRPPR